MHITQHDKGYEVKDTGEGIEITFANDDAANMVYSVLALAGYGPRTLGLVQKLTADDLEKFKLPGEKKSKDEEPSVSEDEDTKYAYLNHKVPLHNLGKEPLRIKGLTAEYFNELYDRAEKDISQFRNIIAKEYGEIGAPELWLHRGIPSSDAYYTEVRFDVPAEPTSEVGRKWYGNESKPDIKFAELVCSELHNSLGANAYLCERNKGYGRDERTDAKQDVTQITFSSLENRHGSNLDSFFKFMKVAMQWNLQEKRIGKQQAEPEVLAKVSGTNSGVDLGALGRTNQPEFEELREPKAKDKGK